MFGKRLVSFLDRLIYASAVLSGLLILVTGIFVGYEVIMRYVFDAPTLWTFDTTIFLIIYAAFLGSAFTLREGKHIRLDFFIGWLSRYHLPSVLLNFLCNIITLVFWLLVTFTATEKTIFAYQFNQITESYLRLPLFIPLIGVVLGSALVFVQLLIDIIKLCSSLAGRTS
jgi:C4-dicarboxylate transporter, DctQ subunit